MRFIGLFNQSKIRMFVIAKNEKEYCKMKCNYCLRAEWTCICSEKIDEVVRICLEKKRF